MLFTEQKSLTLNVELLLNLRIKNSFSSGFKCFAIKVSPFR